MPDSLVPLGLAEHAIEVRGQGRVDLVPRAKPVAPLPDDEVEGRTLVSLISPGTELAGVNADNHTPRGSGYAAVFRVDRVGARVTEPALGQIVFAFGEHAGYQRFKATDVIPIPDGVRPEVAVFCRLVAVSWTTIVTTHARPPAPVVVMGLGIIGNLAAQLFQASGYRVTAIDPVERRRELAAEAGVLDARSELPGRAFERFDNPLSGEFELALDCSGHESAVLAAARSVRRGGEVVLVGVPWQRRSDTSAHDLLDVVFHHFVTIRSGWEWELPSQRQPFAAGSVRDSHIGALGLLASGRIQTDGLAEVVTPRDARRVYADLSRSRYLTALFDWRRET